MQTDDDYPLSGELGEEEEEETEVNENVGIAKSSEPTDETDEPLKELQEKVKEQPEPLQLKNPPVMKLHHFKTNDYIIFRCNLCEAEVTHARKDEDGQFTPWALCQHIIFKGLVAEK